MTRTGKRGPAGRLAAALATMAAVGGIACGTAATAAPERGFDVQVVAPGVYALIRTKPPGMMLDANVVFVVNDRDVVVVDANLNAASARRSIDALRELTDLPVRYLVNTHRHADHTGGNAEWRAAYPALEIVGQADMREDLERDGPATLKGWIDWAGRLTTDLAGALDGGKSLGGAPLDDELRASYAGDLAAARELAADAPRLVVSLPDLTVDSRMTLRRGPRTIEILAPGRGHTRGDLVVWLPVERVLAAGDLVVTPVPLVGSDQSYPEQWIATLDRLLALEPATIVPGHGAVERDPVAMRLYREFLASAVAQTRAAMARGETLEQATAGIDLAPFADRMAGESRVLRALFASWARVPTVAALYRVRDEAGGAR